MLARLTDHHPLPRGGPEKASASVPSPCPVPPPGAAAAQIKPGQASPPGEVGQTLPAPKCLCLPSGALPGSCFRKWKLPDSPRGTRDYANEAASLLGYGSVLQLAPLPAQSFQEHVNSAQRAKEQAGLYPPKALLGSKSNPRPSSKETPGSSPTIPSPALSLSIASNCFPNN